MKNLVGLMLVKKHSNRLPGKNLKDYHGEPMFLFNLRKCLNIFHDVYVSSDCDMILKLAEEEGALSIKRSKELCGETPNIYVYQHAFTQMKEADGIVAVQANSPQVNKETIVRVAMLMRTGLEEVMTCHPIDHKEDYHKQGSKIYGSVWGISIKKLLDYPDAYKPTPEAWVVDDSVDIETEEDYLKAIN